MDAGPHPGNTLVLIRKAKDGSAEALNSLFERFSPFVRKVAILCLGGFPRNEADLDDLVQDALLRAYQGFENFGGKPEDDFRSWIACCARCAIFDNFKKINAVKRGGGRNIKNLSDWGSGYIHDSIFASPQPTPSEVVMGFEQSDRLLEAILDLEERKRRIILYRHICRMSYREIADILGLEREEAARVLCHRALAKVKKKLG